MLFSFVSLICGDFLIGMYESFFFTVVSYSSFVRTSAHAGEGMFTFAIACLMSRGDQRCPLAKNVATF